MTLLVGFVLYQAVVISFYNRRNLTEDEVDYHENKISKFIFAGELLPHTNKKIRKNFNKEVNTITQINPETYKLIKYHRWYFDQIEPILLEESIPDDFKYMAVVESKLKMTARSQMGAVGLWQIQAETAKTLGLVINSEVDERMHLERSTHAVCRYFRQLKKTFGDWTSVAIAYNMGPTALYIAYRRQNKEAAHQLKLNKESSEFIYRILAYKSFFEHPEKYKYKVKQQTRPRTKLRYFEVKKTIPNLTLFASQQGCTLRKLKEYNPWLLANSLTVKKNAKKHYTIILPC